MKKDIVIKIFELLKKEYPNAKCSLNFNSPFEILVAVALSAQCTDERVNKVTSEIFPTYLQDLFFYLCIQIYLSYCFHNLFFPDFLLVFTTINQ